MARRFFHLSYFDARFDISESAGAFHYSTVRTHRDSPRAAFAASYHPVGPAFYRGEGDHLQWPLQRAAAEIQLNTLGDWLGIEMTGPPQTLHFAKSLDVRAWLAERI